jgi:hypothetical protein
MCAISKQELLDAERYRWIREQYANGKETYLAEGIMNGKQLDNYIDKQLKCANSQ